MSESTLFKDQINQTLVETLARGVQFVYPDFPAETFVAQVVPRLEPLALKARVAVITHALAEHLPESYPEALAIVLAALEAPGLSSEDVPNDAWIFMPLVTFVEYEGLHHPEESLAALYRLTERFSGEFAIRPFLDRYPEQTLDRLRVWARDANPHVRRLVSEGTRPRLPWAPRLPRFIADPSPVLALLELLKDDPSPYVRTSVANNLNDIAKDHPDLVVATARRWSQDASDDRRWIVRRALRSLVKQGHPDALAVLGAGTPSARLTALTVAPEQVAIGEQLTLTAEIESTAQEPQLLVVDYILHLAGANGNARRKVFKLRAQTVAPGERLRLRKLHLFKPVTVRRYYPGRHRIDIQVNGQVLGGVDFDVVDG